jgi:AmiS/UreI family transporter
MLGIVLLYVGAVLFINGIGALGKIDKKSVAVMNLFVGSITLLIDIFMLLDADTTAKLYAVGTGLLFAFTYLYVAITNWFDLDGRGLGWYCLFVAITTVPCSLVSFGAGDMRFGAFWLIWGGCGSCSILLWPRRRTLASCCPIPPSRSVLRPAGFQAT